MDELLEKVEKKPIGRRFGGQFLLNPQWQQILDKYCFQGDIMEFFLGMEGASKDPSLKFMNNPMWFQWQQFLMQQQQMQQQQMQQQAQQQQAQGQPQEGQPQEGEEQGGQLTQATDQLQQQLGKAESAARAEKRLDHTQKKLLLHQKKIVDHVMEEFEKDSKLAIAEILEAAGKHLPKS
jgi:hypothetical protein